MYTHTYRGVIYTIGDAFFIFIDWGNLIALFSFIPLIGIPMAALVGLYVYLYPALNTRINSQIAEVQKLKESLPKAPSGYLSKLPQITHPNSSIVWLINIFGGWTIIGWLFALHLSKTTADAPVPPLLASLLREYNLKQTSTNASQNPPVATSNVENIS